MFKKIVSVFMIAIVVFIINVPVFANAKTKAEKFNYEIGSYSIDYKSDTSNPIINCKIAAKAIDGVVIAPEEEFSFNNLVGDRTKEKGYKEALIVMNGEYIPGIAGGICRLSSVLFNAVLETGLEITERWNHSLKVDYVPCGRDAAVYYGSKDFKFKNIYASPIKVSATVEDKKITVKLLSSEPIFNTGSKVKTRLIRGSYYTYRYIGYNINYITKSTYGN